MIRVLLVLVLLLGILFLASENREQRIPLHLLFGLQIQPFSLTYLIVGAFATGAAVVALVLVPPWLRASLKARRQRREIETLEDQLATANRPGEFRDRVETPPREASSLPPGMTADP